MTIQTEVIRLLNDQLRRDFSRGIAVMTPGIAALGSDAAEHIINRIAIFDDFSDDNDPYGEHDFGSFKTDGHTIFFKLDYYDKTLSAGSPNPADPAVTTRVITIMLAEEY
jgi:hypothetical protein